MAKKTVQILGEEVTESGSIDLGAEQVELPDGSRLTEARATDLAAEVARDALDRDQAS